MAGRRSRHDRDPAPGDEPGAGSFARSGGNAAEPTGIVRLADLLPSTSTESRPRPAEENSAFPPAPAGAGGRTRVADRSAANPPRSGSERRDDVRHLPGPGRPTRTPVERGEHPAEAAAHGASPEDEAVPYESLFGPGAKGRRARRERPPATAMQRALGLLTRREHSRKELTRKLVARGVDAAEVESAVERLASAGWQDERRFAESLVRARAASGYGPLHIRAELATHDLPAELRDAALDAFEGDWSEIAADLVRRRFARIDDARVRERKAADFLGRRGFPGEIARVASRLAPDGD